MPAKAATAATRPTRIRRRPANPWRAQLAKLRAYRESDPGFEAAIDGFVKAEAVGAKSDPVEGKRVSTRRLAARHA
jgi:hypothetical protein